MLPGAGVPGELEDVIWQGIQELWPAIASCIEGFLKCARPDGIATEDAAKARVYSYLAATTRPDRALSASARATASSLPFDSTAMRRLLTLVPAPTALE